MGGSDGGRRVGGRACTGGREMITIIPMQRCVELLNSLPELSHRGQLLSSKATLVLADTTCIRGTNHTPSDGMNHTPSHGSTGQQLVKVFAGLINTIKKQVLLQ